jgi:hypothetical protein
MAWKIKKDNSSDAAIGGDSLALEKDESKKERNKEHVRASRGDGIDFVICSPYLRCRIDLSQTNPREGWKSDREES